MAMTAVLTSVTPTQIIAGRHNPVDVVLTISNSAGADVLVTSIVPFCSPTGTRSTATSVSIQPVPLSTGIDANVPTVGSKVFTFSFNIFAPIPDSRFFNVSEGSRKNLTLYQLLNSISLIADDNKTHLYKCTTAGTTAASQPTGGGGYIGTSGEVVTDGSAVFTEQALVSSRYDVGAVCYAADGSVFTPTVSIINVTMPPV